MGFLYAPAQYFQSQYAQPAADCVREGFCTAGAIPKSDGVRELDFIGASSRGTHADRDLLEELRHPPQLTSQTKSLAYQNGFDASTFHPSMRWKSWVALVMRLCVATKIAAKPHQETPPLGDGYAGIIAQTVERREEA